MSLRRATSSLQRVASPRLLCRWGLRARSAGLALLLSVGPPSREATAEVPLTPTAPRREFQVEFSARHLEVDAELGTLSLSGNVEVTVGRYRLGGERVRLRRGPRGIGVEGGGDIAFCSCDRPPITLGYGSVTIAPPSDVVVKNAVLRAGGLPIFWSPYLWLRSPDRVGLIFPSAEWRGADGLLLGSGVHVPFESNQGRPASRALDVSGFGYTRGGARVEARLLTPHSTSLVRWDHRAGTALGVDAHGAARGQTAAIWAYDADLSLGPRGRAGLSSLEAAARRFDHGRLGVGSTGGSVLAWGAGMDAPRAWSRGPLPVGPFALLATGGAWGEATSYAVELGATSAWSTAEARRSNAETRALERTRVETALSTGPVLLQFAAFQQGEALSESAQAVSKLRAGAGLLVSAPLVRHFGRLTHLLVPEIAARFERQLQDGGAESVPLATAGFATAWGGRARGPAARVQLAAGVLGMTPEPVAQASLVADARLVGMRVVGVAEPRLRAAEATARLRLGARGGATLTTYAEARTIRPPDLGATHGPGQLLPPAQRLGGYDREGLTAGAELSLGLGPVLIGGGADTDPIEGNLLAVHGVARYRHACGCLGLGAFAGARDGRPGFDAGLSLDLMP